MTSEEGLNLAGVETVLAMEERVDRIKQELARMRRRAAELERQIWKRGGPDAAGPLHD